MQPRQFIQGNNGGRAVGGAGAIMITPMLSEFWIALDGRPTIRQALSEKDRLKRMSQ
jgi:hypothetical protein